MVVLAEHCGILIDADDFYALLRSDSTEFGLVVAGRLPIPSLMYNTF